MEELHKIPKHIYIIFSVVILIFVGAAFYYIINNDLNPKYDPGKESQVTVPRRALSEFRVEGIKVTVPFHAKVLQDKNFISGDIDTHFLDKFETAE